VQYEKLIVSPMKKEGLAVVQCSEESAQWHSLFGIDAKQDAYYVGDFNSRSAAEFVRDALEAS